MGFIDNFNNWRNKTLTILEYGKTYDPITGTYGDPTWSAGSPAVTMTAGMWNKAAGERYISEQFREEVEDFFVTEVIEIPADCRVTDGTVTWSVITRTDIGYQGEVYLIGVKRVSA